MDLGHSSYKTCGSDIRNTLIHGKQGHCMKLIIVPLETRWICVIHVLTCVAKLILSNNWPLISVAQQYVWYAVNIIMCTQNKCIDNKMTLTN